MSKSIFLRLTLAAFFLQLALAGGGNQESSQAGTVAPNAVNTNLEEPSPWAKSAVELAIKRGWFIGFGDKNFRWKTEVTREQLALVLTRVVGSLNLKDLKGSELTTLMAGLAELRTQIQAQNKLQETLSAALTRLANESRDRDAQVASLTKRVSDLEKAHNQMNANPFYLSVAGSLSNEGGGWGARLGLGHDQLLDNLGARVSYDFSLSGARSSLSADLTHRISAGSVDVFVGLGGGLELEGVQAGFGEVFLMSTYRLSPNLGLFVEANQRTTFEIVSRQRLALLLGLQIRF